MLLCCNIFLLLVLSLVLILVVLILVLILNLVLFVCLFVCLSGAPSRRSTPGGCYEIGPLRFFSVVMTNRESQLESSWLFEKLDDGCRRHTARARAWRIATR